MEKLVVFKIVKSEWGELMELCGYFNNRKEVTEYLTEIKKLIDGKMQHQLKGEYVAVPVIYFNIQPTEIKK